MPPIGFATAIRHPPVQTPHDHARQHHRSTTSRRRRTREHARRVRALFNCCVVSATVRSQPIALAGGPAVRADARHALPAHAQRRHHRRRRGQGRHRLHPAHRRRHARRHAAADRLRDRRPSTSAPVRRWRSAATSGPAIFDRVQAFSAREVGQFGAPSLITRTTNDVQQVQMLVLMTFTLMVSAPIMCVGGIILALRQDVPLSGAAAGRSCRC